MNNMFHRPVSATKRHGFTLVELLVALGIFATLMSGILILFVGSVRTVNQGRQSINAHEMVRGAQMVFQNDIVSSFTARDHADIRNLIGTPIGMVFIGTERGNATSSASKTSAPGVARITYVIYKNNVSGPVTLPSLPGYDAYTLNDGEPIENIFSTDPSDPTVAPTVAGYPYKLIRFVEPGVSQLDDFPINWDYPLPVGVTLKDGTVISASSTPGTLGELRDHYLVSLQTTFTSANIVRFCSTFGIPLPQNTAALNQYLTRYLTVDFWFRMLAGGDRVVPVSAWRNENDEESTHADNLPEKYVAPFDAATSELPIYNNALLYSATTPRMDFEARDYVLCENVASPIKDIAASLSDFAAKNADVFYEGANDIESLENRVFTYRSIYDTGLALDAIPAWWNVPVEEIPRLYAIWAPLTAPYGDPPTNPSDPAYLTVKETFLRQYAYPLRAGLDRLPVSVSMKVRLALQSTTTNAPDFNREFNVEVNIPAGHVRTDQVPQTP